MGIFYTYIVGALCILLTFMMIYHVSTVKKVEGEPTLEQVKRFLGKPAVYMFLMVCLVVMDRAMVNRHVNVYKPPNREVPTFESKEFEVKDISRPVESQESRQSREDERIDFRRRAAEINGQ